MELLKLKNMKKYEKIELKILENETLKIFSTKIIFVRHFHILFLQIKNYKQIKYANVPRNGVPNRPILLFFRFPTSKLLTRNINSSSDITFF